jgi:hypothetical protein
MRMRQSSCLRWSPGATALLALSLLALIAAGCGLGEVSTQPWDDDDAERTPMFKHPPPPGPAPWTYVLTTYGGPSDPSAYLHSVACGGKKPDGAWWYSTGAWSFGCFSRLELRANGKCVVVKVVDNGPAGWVEAKAKQRCGGNGYIIDASPLVSKHLFGTSGAGWSDCKQIQVRPVAGNTQTGPCQGGSTPAPTPPAGACHQGQPFGWTYCSDSCPCDEGMGDCDEDSECKSGLRCAHNTGARYGAGGTVDVCEKPSGSGGGTPTTPPTTPPAPPSNPSYGYCSYAGKTGVCQDSGTACAGGYKSGLCPGPNAIRCCLPTFGSCTYGGKSGQCQLTSAGCSGSYRGGLCPGPNDVKCCLP